MEDNPVVVNGCPAAGTATPQDSVKEHRGAPV